MNLRFKYVIIKHPTECAIHEAYSDLNGKIIAVNGEPLTLYGYDQHELVDIIGLLMKDITNAVPIDGNCEDLYQAFDNISFGNFSSFDLPPTNTNNVVEFKKG